MIRQQDGTRARAGSRSRGMSLLEVMLAMSILTITMTGLIASLMGSHTSTAFSKAQTTALQDAKGVLEALTYLPQEGDAVTLDTLINVATSINLGNANPGGNIQLPIGAQASLTNEAVRVNIYLPVNFGIQPVWGAEVLPGALPTGTYEEYEIVVTVQWLQGQRTVSTTTRTVRNILSR